MVNQKEGQNPHTIKTFFGGVLRLALSIAVILPVVFGILEFLDWRIRDAMNDEQFIRKVASHVRPYVIFDANDAIHVNGGAMQYLEKIEVEIGTREGSIVPVKINITPKHHLSYPPLIETLGAERFMFTPTPKLNEVAATNGSMNVKSSTGKNML
ncbi:MAG: hypothetical protein ACYTBX_08590 [Planctomycetota bacterium]|jgi:hypothetical protein